MAGGRRPPVDWTAVRSRVEALGRAVAGDDDRSPKQTRALLERRAAELARPSAATSVASALELLRVSVGPETYAVESRHVLEIFQLRALAPVSASDSPLAGVTAWRGEVLMLLDLPRITGGAASGLSDLAYVVVLGEQGPAFGVMVDTVDGLVSMREGDVRPLPPGAGSTRANLMGITADAALVVDARALIHLYE